MSEVAAIVLAAGQGSRFGPEPKLLAPFEGKPLVRHVVEAAAVSSADPVIVVTGHRAGEIEAAVKDLPVRFVRNEAFLRRSVGVAEGGVRSAAGRGAGGHRSSR